MRGRCFSLLELVVVIVIIGVIAAIAVPRVSGFAESARSAAGTESLRRAQLWLQEYEAIHGEYPADLAEAIPTGESLPCSPFLPEDPRSIEVETKKPELLDPKQKVVGGNRTAYWYNSGNGNLRMRVSGRRNDDETLALYNAVNGTALTELN